MLFQNNLNFKVFLRNFMYKTIFISHLSEKVNKKEHQSE